MGIYSKYLPDAVKHIPITKNNPFALCKLVTWKAKPGHADPCYRDGEYIEFVTYPTALARDLAESGSKRCGGRYLRRWSPDAMYILLTDRSCAHSQTRGYLEAIAFLRSQKFSLLKDEQICSVHHKIQCLVDHAALADLSPRSGIATPEEIKRRREADEQYIREWGASKQQAKKKDEEFFLSQEQRRTMFNKVERDLKIKRSRS